MEYTIKKLGPMGVLCVAAFIAAPAAADCDRETIAVNDADELHAALDEAKPGTRIEMADGYYHGNFEATASGKAHCMITLTGSRDAVMDGDTLHHGYGLYLQGDYWRLEGFTVRDALKGIVLDGANHNRLTGITVHHLGEEAVHFRTRSSNNVLQDCEIYKTGLATRGFGEGVYIGSAQSHWDTYTNGNPDRSDDNKVLGCTIGPDVTAEHVDAKEGTSGGVISGNTFYGKGMSGANYGDSFVDVKGDHYSITDNQGINDSPSALKDGFQTHVIVDGWGEHNYFSDNKIELHNASGVGFAIAEENGHTFGNVVRRDNVVKRHGVVVHPDAEVSNVPLSD